jgi:hypothetical protein
MKTVKEISIKLENKPGKLSALSDLLAAEGIVILALTVRPAGATGIVSFVVTDPLRVVNILEGAGYKATLTDIIAAEAPQHPGGFSAVLRALKAADVNIEYLYTCINSNFSGDRVILLLGVSDVSAAHDALSREWIPVYGEELYSL